MVKNKLLVLGIIAVLSAGAIFAQEKTKINDASAAKMLLGRHKLSLQWISWDYFGTATVTKRQGVYAIEGKQKGRGNSDILTIEGMIVSIDARHRF
jgi:hypothetical protein